MGLFSTLGTIFKGKVNETADAIADENSITILTQHIREAKDELTTADRSLVSIIADRKLIDKKVAEIEASIAKYEGYARAALEKGDQPLALECAQKVASLRNDLESSKKNQAFYQGSENKMRQSVQTSKDRIAQLESQVDIIKANESVQRAQAATLSSVQGGNSKVTTAVDSLARIQAKQEKRQAEFEAAAELASSTTESNLESKLAEAGIAGGNSSAEDELARIMAGK
jgi:phage shock protein A